MSTPAGPHGAAPPMGSNRFSRQKTKGMVDIIISEVV